MRLGSIPKDGGTRPPPSRHGPGDSTSLPAVASERHGYRPAAGNRWIGLGGTVLTICMVMAGFFVVLSTGVVEPPRPSSLTVMNLAAPASPSETPPKKREAPKPVERKETPPDPAPVGRVEPTPAPIAPAPIPAATPRPTDPVQQEVETAAPKTAPAPPAPRIASSGPDNWEGRVLARLEKHRRYPQAAMARRQQGVPYIRFVMDRQGKVLSVQLERSSGYSDLDREAMALPKRAQPLPAPPDSRSGATLELVVPVEFFLR